MIRIKSIKFYNHIFFGNQKFEFYIDEKKPAKNIIFAGENGSGKTKLLNELNSICNESFYLYTGESPKKLYELVVDLSDDNFFDADNGEHRIDEAKLEYVFDERNQKRNVVKFLYKNNLVLNVKRSEIKINTFKINSLYSSVDINYKPRRDINSITNKTLDDTANRSSDDIASDVIQLLIDIINQDNSDLDNWVNQNKGKIIPDDIFRVRLKRFTNAFYLVFGDTLKFKRIKNNTIPLFEKGGNEIEIQSLSSGEKQIIFRGVYLLRNKNSLKGVPVFIDEPELSMHPKWEEKIFDYYRKLFLEGNIQTSQIFIATHSEHVLANALDNEESLIIKFDCSKQNVEKYYKKCSGLILPIITLSEIKYNIFDMYTIDFHILLYGHIQQYYVKDSSGKNIVEPTIKKTDTWLESQNVTKKKYTYGNTTYVTLQTYIRNCIDHPDNTNLYSKQELQQSINEMINIIIKQRQSQSIN